MDLHAKIMNIKADTRSVPRTGSKAFAYKMGHRDARHAAAELAMSAENLAYTKGVVWAISTMLREPGQRMMPEELWNESGIKKEHLGLCDKYDADPILGMLEKEGE